MFVIEQPILPAPTVDSEANELKSMFEKQAGVESVGLILNGLTSNFAGFVRNYNMHNMGKIICELADQYELRIEKKGHMIEMIWENCKNIQSKAKEWWYDYWLEEDEKLENGDKNMIHPRFQQLGGDIELAQDGYFSVSLLHFICSEAMLK
ncbi:hypothetical protein Tco_1120074 [Tanacetum coccineum]